MKELVLLKCPHHTKQSLNSISNDILYKNRKNNTKIHMELQKTSNIQSNPEQKEQPRDILFISNYFYFQCIVIKTE
jgi:hypothetical protein